MVRRIRAEEADGDFGSVGAGSGEGDGENEEKAGEAPDSVETHFLRWFSFADSVGAREAFGLRWLQRRFLDGVSRKAVPKSGAKATAVQTLRDLGSTGVCRSAGVGHSTADKRGNPLAGGFEAA